MRRVFAGESVALHSQTGSGKTLAYMLPLLARLRRDPLRATYVPRQALIICPSRELAMQSCEVARGQRLLSGHFSHGRFRADARRHSWNCL